MVIQLNYKSGKPVYLQVVDQIKSATASGALRPGEPLPSIRPLAEQLRINRNTVSKAYAELESQGIIETIAGKGCFVSEGNSPFKRQVRENLLAADIDAAIVQAHNLQVSDADFLAMVKERLKAFADQNKSNDEARNL
ncbi:MAG TPA: GntR family transcriptional regulator [Verrucomicrobiae bacterium]|jgi:GntR family transcriptional regulator|nr:GntR family transcriptional regulator [Verrucomicrobiae bacterium]